MVSFIASAVNKDNYPSSNKEIVFVGRSNAGKSSLINSLYGKIAYVGKTPGKTKTLNFFDVDGLYSVCDAPGYGYAKRSDKEIILFGNMMEEYFSNRSELKLCIIVLDIRRIPNNDDKEMFEYCKINHIPCLFVLNKADKLSGNDITNQTKIIKNELNIDDSNIVVTSTLKGKNIDSLKLRINSYL